MVEEGKEKVSVVVVVVVIVSLSSPPLCDFSFQVLMALYVVDVLLLWHKNSSLYVFAGSSLSNVIRKEWGTGHCPEYPKCLSE